MRTLMEDLTGRLDEVERTWLRRPAVCMVLPVAIILSIVTIAVIAVYVAVMSVVEDVVSLRYIIKDFIRDCW